MIITNGYIEDMKNTQEIAQEKLNLQVSIHISILINLLKFNETRYLSQYLSIYRATRFQNIAFNVNSIGYLFMGLCKSNRNRRAQLKGPLSSYLNKEVEKKKKKKKKTNPKKLHMIFSLKL